MSAEVPEGHRQGSQFLVSTAVNVEGQAPELELGLGSADATLGGHIYTHKGEVKKWMSAG